jgi:hypothetical protein
MRYVLIANNKKLNSDFINKIELDAKNDILIFFNYMWPYFTFEKLRNHPRKFYIGRQRPVKEETKHIPYAGIDLVKEHENEFEKIFFHTCPDHMKKSENYDMLKNAVDSFNFDPNKLDCLEPISNGIRKDIGYPKGKNMSSGIIAYEYIKRIKEPHDDILLVGFTSELAKKFHNDDWESNYFRSQIKRNICKSIGCYDTEQKKYMYIYDKLKWGSYLKGNHGDKAIDIVKSFNPKSIIDIGCGPNLFCKQTIGDYCECVGVDFAGNFFDLYSDICVGLDTISDKQFDLVTAFDVMEHLLPSCIHHALREMKRISNSFIFKIDYHQSIKIVMGSTLHPTVKPKKWWKEQISEYCSSIDESKGYLYGKW